MNGFALTQGLPGVWQGEFSKLTELGVRHGFSARSGGVSCGEYGSLNLALHVGDDAVHVAENRRRFAGGLQLDSASLVTVNQVHGERILLVDEAARGRGAFSQADVLGDADGLVTDAPNLPLAMFFADCVPLLFVDPKKRALGVAHAGWRGTAAQIGRRMLETMQHAYGSRPSDCWLAIGPSIHPCCYCVGEEVAAQFPAACSSRSGDGSVRLDLQAANRLQALAAGLPPQQVLDSGVCTCCNRETFFSYRADGGRTGRLALVAALSS